MIWTEKYRPKDFSDIRGQEQIIEQVKALVTKKNIPHLLFAGPAGVGKSSLAIVIARTLYAGSTKQNFLELNASDERGIDTVRIKVKDFARTRALGEVPFKIIFLDECDALTREAQQALRRTMENYTQTARFILSCNYVSKVIEPIQSRCVIFKFKQMPNQSITEIVSQIAKTEGIELDEQSKNLIVEASEGDCRRAVNILQSCGGKVTPETVLGMANIARPKEMQDVLEKSVSGDFASARDLLLEIMVKYGLSGLDVVKQIQRYVWNLSLNDRKKVAIIERCGEIEFRMTEGSDEFVQLEALLATIVANS